MANEYGLDVNYFRKKLEIVQRDISMYRPEELATELARLAQTAASQIEPLSRQEFADNLKAEALARTIHESQKGKGIINLDPIA